MTTTRRAADEFQVPRETYLPLVLVCAVPASLLFVFHHLGGLPAWVLVVGAVVIVFAAWLVAGSEAKRVIIDDRAVRIQFLRGAEKRINLSAVESIALLQVPMRYRLHVDMRIPVLKLRNGDSFELRWLHDSAHEVYVAVSSRLPALP